MKQGFTLIETIIYVAIVGGFITTSILLTYQIIDFSDSLEKQRELGENQRFLVQKLNWVLSGVSTITTPTTGNTSATLDINKIGIGQLVVDASGDVVRLKTGVGAPIPLTNDYASTTNLLFEHLNFSGKSAIRITADLSNKAATTSVDTTIIIQ